MKTYKFLDNKIHTDSRGAFVRTFDCANREHPNITILQSNISFNPSKGTLRGMHFQVSGPPEDKLISLLSGSMFVTLVDLRHQSPNYLEKTEFELRTPFSQTIFVPSGYATGWITTAPNVSVLYQMTARYEECQYSGFRFNDPHFSINWPITPSIISEQDKTWPDFDKKQVIR